ncbi:MAG: hypothetical protein LBL13_09690 [Bacteroidales bacterium]|jgi:uncharacterized FlaG/YvyC family protein|nr:hypothetical protein [Bacteroidales bacterium]
MTISKPFNGDTTCSLCGSPAKTLSHFEAYTHLQCRDCGEYSITLQAEAELKNSPDIKYILSGLVFENSYAGSPIQIKSGDVVNIKNKSAITTIEKMYKLANYLYSETIKLGLGQKIKNIPMACCYAKDRNEFFSLWDILKTKNIIFFERITHNTSESPAIYTNPVFTVQAKTIFDKGINSVEDFMEAFMDNNSRVNKISVNINDSTNSQVNVAADGSTIKAEQYNNPDIKEIIKLLDDLIPQIPNNLSAEIKQQIGDSISAIKSELKIQKPNKSIIKTLLIRMKGLVTTAGFLASIATILDFLNKI